ncbi:polysaccharide deacetylase family protein [Thermoactinomyces sp. DSM 45892]|uniref:polysaccharide deacetylase family protein n=1 Tax=Thermoactinomyces sp. DSM 45892 TaxID=1882753 RepID=UPI0008975919|nr:polysaccharide deacetylase family protein [Thermoactinomyces sp. DSM 45892]SDY47663.1 probable sporulation protein, polysaccharide deacetylase family [Thermoactinomyces sp. DSM 45892]
MNDSKRMIAIFISFIIAISIVQAELIQQFVMQVKSNSVFSVVQYTEEEKRYLQKMKADAPKHYKAPIDAKMDSIWKAIPELEGREVDMEASLKASMQKNNGEIVWKYKKLAPKKRLSDLVNTPVYRGNSEQKAVGLMVNVAWGTEHLKGMLSILDKEGIKATFFLDGSWLNKNQEVAKELVKKGHEIGNHGYTHPLMGQVSKERVEREITRTEDLIYQTLHIHSKWFAPPAGDFNQQVVEMVEKYKMKTVLWTCDTIDWKKSSSPERIVSRVQKVEPGMLLLTHPTDRTVDALPAVIQEVKKKGLVLTSVGKVLSPERID